MNASEAPQGEILFGASEGQTTITTKIPDYLWARWRMLCRTMKKNPSEVLRELVEDFVQQNGGKMNV